MDDAEFDRIARDELHHLEDALSEVDPDECEVTSSEGVLKLDLRDGTRIVINSHRAARQIWMAAISTAWHFDPVVGDEHGASTWRAAKTNEDLRPTLARLLRERIGLAVAL
jgi:CyaY protein